MFNDTFTTRQKLIGFGGGILLGLAIIGLTQFASGKAGATSLNERLAAAGASSASWTGCWAGASAGMAAMDTKAGLSAPAPTGTLISIEGLSATGGLLTVDGGCDVQLKDSKFVFGVFGGYGWYKDAEWTTSIPSGPLTVTTALDKEWSVGARAGFTPHQNTLIYGLLAYTEMDMKAFTVSGAATGSLGLPTFTGWQVGGGVEHRISGPLSLKMEYRYSKLDEEHVAIPGGGGIMVDIEPSVHTARAALVYRFGQPNGPLK